MSGDFVEFNGIKIILRFLEFHYCFVNECVDGNCGKIPNWIELIYGFSGEFNHTLKGFKIPLKENVIGNACDTPAPPGTEDFALQQSNANTYISPLATVYEAPQSKFEILPHSQPHSQQQSLNPMPAAVIDNPKVKSSSLFSKIIIIIMLLLTTVASASFKF